MTGDPIDEYLAALRAGLRTPPARTAEILAEAEDHLRESAAAARRAGHLSEAAAQRAAIDAFGPAKQVTRAHRPPLTAFAAAAGLQAWPVLGWYLLLSGALGWTFYSSFSPTRDTLAAWMPPTGEAVRLGVFLLLGVLLVGSFLIVRRRQRRSGAAPARLPNGIFPLGAAIGFFAIAMLLLSVTRALSFGHEGWLQVAMPGLGGAILMAVGYGLWFLVGVVGGPVKAERHVRAARPAASSYVAAAGLTACQVLGGYLLLSGLTGCLLMFPDVADFYQRPDGGLAAAIFGGYLLAGVPLVALPLIVKRRRRAPARLSRGLSLLCAVVLLLALGIAEYAFVALNLMGLAGGSGGPHYLLLAGECAAVLLGAGWALRTLVSLVSLVSWTLRRGDLSRRRAAPGPGPGRAPAG